MGNKLPIAIFVAFIAVFSLISVFKPSDETSVAENRALQMLPEVSYDEVMNGKFQEKYETYISDQFVGRPVFVSVKTAIEKTMGKRDMNGVYIGKEGYLIEKYEASDFEDEHVNENIEYLSSFLTAAGKQFGKDHVTLAFVPSKGSVLKNKLPLFADEYDSSWITEKLKKSIGESGTCNVIDFEPALSAHSDEYIYYRTDHHWTSLGAYYAYEEICRQKGADIPQLSDYRQTVVADDFYGSSYDKVQLKVRPDDVTRFDQTDQNSKSDITIDFNDGTEKWNTFYYEKALKEKDKYTYFLGGNDAKIHIVNNKTTAVENENRKILLLVKDSYSNCFVEFPAKDYDDIYMIDLRYTNDHILDIIDSIEAMNPITDVLVMFNREKFMTDNNIEQLECEEDDLLCEDEPEEIDEPDDEDEDSYEEDIFGDSEDDEDEEDEGEDDGVTEEEDIF